MSLHHAAQHLKAQGRGPDDQLIHMSKKEVAGLQALAMAHGGSLTVNPKTGLPEAGFLDNLLPTIVGAGLTYFSGGAINPMTAAMIMGGGTALHTGDLGKGLMAGLGAYGGGTMGAGFAGMGESALGNAAYADAAASGLSPEATQAAVADKISGASLMDKAKAASSVFGKEGTMAALGGGKTAAMAAAPAIGSLLGGNKTLSTAPGTEQMIRPYTFAANPQQLAQQEKMIGSKYEPGQDTSERTWFKPEYTALTPYKAAEGGLMDFSQGGVSDGPVTYMAHGGLSSLTSIYTGDDVMPMGTDKDEEEKRMAQGGISDLGSYSDGGRLLKGPGDGMSDNIPARIGAKQPARLADGEFVIPADVVSHLGNGSTDAGAKQLYKMMDRIRQQRTGKKKQAPEIKPKKVLAA